MCIKKINKTKPLSWPIIFSLKHSKQITNLSSHHSCAAKMVTLNLILTFKCIVGMKPLQLSHGVAQSQYPQDPQLLLSMMGMSIYQNVTIHNRKM